MAKTRAIFVAAVAMCAISLLPALTHANEEAAPAATEQRWYGLPVAAADATAVLLVWAASRVDKDATAGAAVAGLGGPLGVAGIVFNGAVSHYINDHNGRIAGSFGLRLGLPVAGLLLANATCSATPADDCSDSAMSGAALGLFTALVLDDFVLAVEERPSLVSAPGWQIGLAPRGEGGFTASVGATF